MSRCFKHYDVKHLRRRGCVPATREATEGENADLRSERKVKDN